MCRIPTNKVARRLFMQSTLCGCVIIIRVYNEQRTRLGFESLFKITMVTNYFTTKHSFTQTTSRCIVYIEYILVYVCVCYYSRYLCVTSHVSEVIVEIGSFWATARIQ